MPTHVALIRAINVGGRGRLAMADLRTCATSLGWRDVASYIQSGNLVFTAAGTNDDLASALASRIAEVMDDGPRAVQVLTADELAAARAANPFATEHDPRLVHLIVHTAADPSRQARVADAVAQARTNGDLSADARSVGRVTYLHTPDGLSASKLAAMLTTRKATADQQATARNLATVDTLLEMTQLDTTREPR